jgi:HEAT repeat protein
MMRALTLLFSGAVAASSLFAPAARAQGAVGAKSADSLYRIGQGALRDRDYRRAANLFQQIGDKYPTAPRAGDALYWRSYSLYAAGADGHTKSDLDAAASALRAYQAAYANQSTLANDAADLAARIRTAQAQLGDAAAAGEIAQSANKLRTQQPCSHSQTGDDTRMAALDGLISMSAADAIPILQDVLKQYDVCRVELRKKAVWMLAQQAGKDAVPALLDVARRDPSEDVREQAIFWLGSTSSELAVPALDSILFASTADEALREKAVFALSQQSGSAARAALQRAAEDQRLSDDLRGNVIFGLGQSGIEDFAYFRRLFQKTTNKDLRQKIVFTVSQSSLPEAGKWLIDMAKDKSLDDDIRKDAIFQASQRRTVDLDQLEAIYNEAKADDEIQKQVIFVYSRRSEPAAVDKLMTIAKSDPSLDMRKSALFWLGQKNDPRVRQFIRDLITK